MNREATQREQMWETKKKRLRGFLVDYSSENTCGHLHIFFSIVIFSIEYSTTFAVVVIVISTGSFWAAIAALHSDSHGHS